MYDKSFKAGDQMPETVAIPTESSIIDMQLFKAHADWDATSPRSLTIDEALKFFVEGMEFGHKTQQKAIESTFNNNLELVLNKAKEWFGSLKSRNVPVLAMFVKPESIYRFSVLIAVDTEYYISDEMLGIYSQSRDYFGNRAFRNLLVSYSYMAVTDSRSIDRDMTIADGYFFEYKT